MLGIFDSGIGGLTVAKEIKKKYPYTPLIYYGDTARCPWGTKNKKTVEKYSEEICRFLIKKKAKEIVIACNTASAQASKYLRKKFPQVTFFDVINPVIKRIEKEAQKKSDLKILVIGTSGTIASKAYQNKISRINSRINSRIKVYSRACPLFVPIVEENGLNNKIAKNAAEKYLAKFRDKKIDFVILGCTHYPLLKKLIEKTTGAKTISSAQEIANYIDLEKNRKNSNPKDQYFLSDISENHKLLGEKIMGKRIKFKKF